jgi:hypothetical protein
MHQPIVSSDGRQLLSWWFPIPFIAGAAILGVGWLWKSGRQLETLRFHETTGRIVAISATCDDNPDANGFQQPLPTSTLRVRFAYTVSAQRYESERYRLTAWPFSTRWADDFVRRHSPGSETAVYYDHRDPARAVLRRGLDGVDLFALLAMVQLSLPAVFVSAVTWGPPTVARRDARTPIWGPWGECGIALILTGMLSSQYLVLSRGQFDPPLETMYWVWGASLAIGAAAFAWARVRQSRRQRSLTQ